MCNKLSICLSTRMLKIRIMEHKSCIRNKNMEKPLGIIFLEAGHGLKDFRFFAFYEFHPCPFNMSL